MNESLNVASVGVIHAQNRLEVIMRITLFSALTAAVFSGCIIVGEMPKGTWDDTGEPIVEMDPADGERQFSVTPPEVELGGAHTILVSAKPALEADLVVDLIALNGAKVARFMPTEDGIAATLSVPTDATPGPVTLLLEYADGDVDVLRDALDIVEPLPNLEDDDTGAPADEQPE